MADSTFSSGLELMSQSYIFFGRVVDSGMDQQGISLCPMRVSAERTKKKKKNQKALFFARIKRGRI
jgi:hypothetical protein